MLGVNVSGFLLGGEEDVFEGSEGFGLVFGEGGGDNFEVREADLWDDIIIRSAVLSAGEAFLRSWIRAYLSEKLSSSRRCRGENDPFPTDHLKGWKVQRERHPGARTLSSIVGCGRIGRCGSGCAVIVGVGWRRLQGNLLFVNHLDCCSMLWWYQGNVNGT